jgi:hypothetical protein
MPSIVRGPSRRVAIEFAASFVVVSALFAARPAAALEVRVKELATASATVRASLEVLDIVPDRFKRLLDSNGALHLRIQAELWEARPVWDRLVYPAIVRVVRLTPTASPADPMPLQVELGKSDRIAASGRYYLHVIATLGTLADRDVDDVGDAVFGRESEANSLGSLGRLVFRTALQINDYLQSVSTDMKSRRMSGSDLLKPIAP